MNRSPRSVLEHDPEKMGGALVFVGTRVPVRALLDYLEAGHPLNEFLDDFPTVSRDTAVAALDLMEEAVVAYAI
jgi:uncharacterized protein (DUF433 family)